MMNQQWEMVANVRNRNWQAAEVRGKWRGGGESKISTITQMLQRYEHLY